MRCDAIRCVPLLCLQQESGESQAAIANMEPDRQIQRDTNKSMFTRTSHNDNDNNQTTKRRRQPPKTQPQRMPAKLYMRKLRLRCHQSKSDASSVWSACLPILPAATSDELIGAIALFQSLAQRPLAAGTTCLWAWAEGRPWWSVRHRFHEAVASASWTSATRRFEWPASYAVGSDCIATE